MMKKIIYNILCSLYALLMINGGLNKFLNYMPIPDDLPEPILKDNAALVEIEWLLPLIAVAELLGGILILIPKTRPLGVLVIFPVMVGILLTHLTTAPDGLMIALILWAVLLWMIYENNDKYLSLFK